MKSSPDSVQIVSLLGTIAGYFGANYDRIAAALCALCGVAYTLWKWRREIRESSDRQGSDKQ